MFKLSASMPSHLLRLESLAVFAGASLLYAQTGGDGWAFILLFFVPDVSMVGYLVNPRVGSGTYNAVHTYASAMLLGGLALAMGWTLGLHLALIWAAHIAFDRVLGYGLKYATGFKDTHVQRV